MNKPPRSYGEMTDRVHRGLEGFQLLHAVYSVEYFLQGLVQRKCNFHLVFFDEHQEACIPRCTSPLNRQKYLLARSVFIRHFQAYQPGSITLRVFEAIHDPYFDHYLNATGVYFMLCHDGAHSINDGEKLSPPGGDTVGKLRVEDEESVRKVVFRSMILSLIKRGYNIALINGLEWMDTKVLPPKSFSAVSSLDQLLGDDHGCRRFSPSTSKT